MGLRQSSETVRVTPALATERPLLESMLQFYIYDFSEMEPMGSTRFELDGDGRFDRYPLDDYWSLEGHHPLLVRVSGQPVGFALINTRSHRDDSVIAHNVAEFWVARKHRRGGVGAEAVRQILALYPGYWEAAVVERNLAAKVFWPRALGSAENARNLTRHEGDGEHWTGPIWSVEVG